MGNWEQLTRSQEEAIARSWLEAVCDSYAPDAASLLRGDGNRFTNPVGHILSEGVAGAWAGLLRSDEEMVRRNLLEILKVRAVQEMAPSQAVGFVFRLKDIVRKAFEGQPPGADALEFDARIDRAILIAFDLYAECRERVAALRVAEAKRNVSQILRLSGYLDGDPAKGKDPAPGGDR